MKKLMILFTLVALTVINTESIIAHTQCAPTVDRIEDVLSGGAYLTIAGKFGGKITKSKLAKITTLDIQGCAAGAKIFQFVLVINCGGTSTSIKGDSGKLTMEIRQELMDLSKGDEFWFTDVKAHLNSRTDVDVWAKKFIVT